MSVGEVWSAVYLMLGMVCSRRIPVLQEGDIASMYDR